MCYLNQVNNCKTIAMLYMNYIKHNSISIPYFIMHVKQNANNAMHLLNQLTHKTINKFYLNQSKHNALNAMCYLNQVKQCNTNAIFFELS